MSDLDPDRNAPASPVAPAASPVAPSAHAVRSDLSDGEWHRLHPLSPLLRGGLTLIVLIGIVVANLRDRLISLFLPEGMNWEEEGDPVDYILDNGVIVPALLVVGGGLLLLVAIFWLSWRFHTFRITDDDVEVRSGVLFRTHRRAPLDRVQGVNLTRPALARLVGLAKLEVVGAGLDANVKLEYLSTSNAETIRGDILRLASGRQKADAAVRRAAEPQGAVGRISAGVGEIVLGVDEDDTEPASIVRVPLGRLILANLLSGSTIWFLALIVAAIVGVVLQPAWLIGALGASIPAAIGFGTYAVRQFIRTLRYSIAPTSAGVRVTFGLLTTVTETLPPGRVHAVDVRQPLLWRWGGWWRIRVNRLSGRSATDTSSTQFADVLPIGSADDVERVLRLLLPAVEVDAALLDAGLRGPRPGDGYTVSPRRARWFLPLSQPRNGFRLLPEALLLRRGRLWPALVILPLARLQSVRVDQGPLDRALGLARVTGHTVVGPVSGALGGLDSRDAVALWRATTDATVDAAASADRVLGAGESVEIEWGADTPAPEPRDA
ncbi:putative membrane protein [Microbacterium marinum]|uniref:Putative membrane protein n=1 Tax=Microbacterium marinum TaxID=421115 RepID=A0A7W7BPL1_9MICO|nr:putative membrane protein [Microbacterium marinum]